MDFISIIIVVLILIVAAFAFANRSDHQDYPIIAIPIMTQHEIVFVQKLVQAVDQYGVHVFPQVSMSAFLKVKPGTDRKTAARTRNRFAQKRADFVIVDDSMKILLIVELDDASHNDDKDRARDKLSAAAGIPTIRLRNGRRISIEEIKTAIAPYLQTLS